MASATRRDDLELEYLFCPLTGQDVPDTSANGYDGVLGLSNAVEPYGVGSPGTTVVYDPDWVSNGVYISGDPFSYNGSVIRAPDDSVLLSDQWTDITFEIWFNPDSPLTGTLIALGHEALYLSPSDVYFYYIKDAFGRVDYDQITLTAGNLPPTGTWTHWIVTRTANNIEWYINGVLAQSKSLALDRFGSSHYPNSKLALYTNYPRPTSGEEELREHVRYIGAGSDNSLVPGEQIHNSFNGRIGEVRIYSIALDAAQALFNFNASNYYPDGKNSCGIGPAARYYAM